MISILLPLHNGIEFLGDSISSIRNQTYPSWELLIGVNGVEITSEEYRLVKNEIRRHGDGRIVVLDGLEKGKSKTLNTLVAHAKYNVICLIDADDSWLPTKLEKQLAYMEKYDVVGTNCQYFGDRTDEPVIFLGKLSKDMFSFQNPLINSSIMLKKEDGYWDEDYEPTNDYDLSVKLLDRDKTFYNIPEVLTKHRIYPTSGFANKYDEYRIRILERLPKLDDNKNKILGRLLDTKEWII